MRTRMDNLKPMRSRPAVAFAVAAAALVLPVLWGLAVHLIFNWISRRCGETPSEKPVMQDYQI